MITLRQAFTELAAQGLADQPMFVLVTEQEIKPANVIMSANVITPVGDIPGIIIACGQQGADVVTDIEFFNLTNGIDPEGGAA